MVVRMLWLYRQSLHSRAKAKAESLNTATCRESRFDVLVSQAELEESQGG